jgi:hypothetical protein
MKSRWKLREPYFRGPNTYTVGPKDGEQIEVRVDANGFFELENPPKFPLGVFARQAD